jgi:hypothetical protein
VADNKKDINERNAEFWAARKVMTDELIGHLPTAKLSFAMYQTHVKQTPFAQQKPYELALEAAANLMNEHAEALRSAVNSANAKSPRPARKSKHKELVVLAMKQARRNHQQKQDFIDGAEIGSWSGLKIKKVKAKDVIRYDIRCDGLKTIRRDHKTLDDWWAEADPELAG